MKPQYVKKYEALERSHWWWLSRRRIVRTVLDDRKGLVIGEGRPNLLDIGCGAGINLAALRGNYDCVGLEPNPNLADAARANSGVTVHEASLSSVHPLKGQHFDFVLLLDVIEHIDDDVTALKVAAELLKPRGLMLINVPAMPILWSVHDEINEHKRRYTHAGLRTVVVQAGLDVSSIRYWGSCLAPLAYLLRKRARGNDATKSYAVSIPPSIINRMLQALVGFEYRCTTCLPIPFGLSLIAAAVKKPMR